MALEILAVPSHGKWHKKTALPKKVFVAILN
jgi:hypothetical protein